MRRLLAIVLLALLPVQFGWAAVAVYCGHETPASVEHSEHHAHLEHEDRADATASGHAEPVAAPGADAQVQGDNIATDATTDADCNHCHCHSHGSCSAMLTRPSDLPAAVSATRPSAALDEAGAGHAPTRPERPQWLPLA